ncbi:hypothetical protein DFH11DRAFT_1626729 [Phellopilus nigrolimitatus]|nr:hypothetical protein DFH11DRAFT_1626729 [Phellopilus nigrolimitatus]
MPPQRTGESIDLHDSPSPFSSVKCEAKPVDANAEALVKFSVQKTYSNSQSGVSISGRTEETSLVITASRVSDFSISFSLRMPVGEGLAPFSESASLGPEARVKDCFAAAAGRQMPTKPKPQPWWTSGLENQGALNSGHTSLPESSTFGAPSGWFLNRPPTVGHTPDQLPAFINAVTSTSNKNVATPVSSATQATTEQRSGKFSAKEEEEEDSANTATPVQGHPFSFHSSSPSVQQQTQPERAREQTGVVPLFNNAGAADEGKDRVKTAFSDAMSFHRRLDRLTCNEAVGAGVPSTTSTVETSAAASQLPPQVGTAWPFTNASFANVPQLPEASNASAFGDSHKTDTSTPSTVSSLHTDETQSESSEQRDFATRSPKAFSQQSVPTPTVHTPNVPSSNSIKSSEQHVAPASVFATSAGAFGLRAPNSTNNVFQTPRNSAIHPAVADMGLNTAQKDDKGSMHDPRCALKPGAPISWKTCPPNKLPVNEPSPSELSAMCFPQDHLLGDEPVILPGIAYMKDSHPASFFAPHSQTVTNAIPAFTERFQNVCAIPAYSLVSPEEIRLLHYRLHEQGRRDGLSENQTTSQKPIHAVASQSQALDDNQRAHMKPAETQAESPHLAASSSSTAPETSSATPAKPAMHNHGGKCLIPDKLRLLSSNKTLHRLRYLTLSDQSRTKIYSGLGQ